jgi:hypothetical protein
LKNLPASTVITGIDSMPILDRAIEAVRTFKPMSKAEVSALLARAAQAASTGKYELMSSTTPRPRIRTGWADG